MNPSLLLLITQILALATQAASSIPQIEKAFTSPTATTTAEQQAQIKAQLQDAQTNLQQVVQHAQAALGTPISTPAA